MTDVSVASFVELESFHTAEPVPKASVRWAADLTEPLLGDAVMLVPYAIANEHVGLHAVLVDRPLPDYATADAVTAGLAARPVAVHRSDDLGGIGASWADGNAVFIVTWDGRDPDGRRATLRALALLLSPHFDDPGRPPRLVVPSPADWTILRDALAWELPLRLSFHDREIERFALATHWWIERAKAPGQLSVVTLADHLHRAWQVPLEPDDQLHLGATLACFGAAAGDAQRLLEEVRQAERQPAGPRSLPTFDNNILLDALGVIGRPPDSTAWEVAMDLLWDHVAHRREHLHRAARILFGDPHLPAASSVASTGVRSRPGLIDVEREEWRKHIDRRAEVSAEYDAYHDLYVRVGPHDPATDPARRSATSLRNQRLPRHLFRSRFRDFGRLGDALELRSVVEDAIHRAEARRRGIALPGQVVSAPPPVASPPALRGNKWTQVFTYRFTVEVAGERPIGRFRPGRDLSFGPVGLMRLADVVGDGVIETVDHGTRRVTVSYTRGASSTRDASSIRVPAVRFAIGDGVELLPACRFTNLGDAFDPVGPRPTTHIRPTGGGQVVLGSPGAPLRPVPSDLR